MNGINMKAITNCSDHRKVFSERLNKLINKAYGEKRGSKKQFYEDFSTVLENNNIGDGKSIDEAGKNKFGSIVISSIFLKWVMLLKQCFGVFRGGILFTLF